MRLICVECNNPRLDQLYEIWYTTLFLIEITTFSKRGLEGNSHFIVHFLFFNWLGLEVQRYLDLFLYWFQQVNWACMYVLLAPCFSKGCDPQYHNVKWIENWSTYPYARSSLPHKRFRVGILRIEKRDAGRTLPPWTCLFG